MLSELRKRVEYVWRLGVDALFEHDEQMRRTVRAKPFPAALIGEYEAMFGRRLRN
ncbi:MAG: hypothetical protein MO853_03020 [Candidatus Protistobacter heckmanni]|nr:hypothetical protein [Candidatus Protistobacter heckmanni]